MPLIMLLGGARSGKSRLAVRMASAGGPVAFLATAQAGDAEMAERIERHRQARPAGWLTVEEPCAVPEALGAIDAAHTVILDCLTLWVANLLGAGLSDAEVLEQSVQAARQAADRPGTVIAVSNEVGSGIVPVNNLGRRYRDLLGGVNASWVAVSHRAALVVAGRLLWLPPAEPEP